MSGIGDPLAVAVVAFLLGAAATRIHRPAEGDADEMGRKMTLQLLLVPACLAVLIFILDGLANHIYLARWL